MANTYSQISIHAVFAVKGRANVILSSWRDELHKYINGIISAETICFAVGGWKDHVHIFFSLPTSHSVAQILQMVKSNSSRWINERKFIKGKFQWQEGYGAFSYSRDRRDTVIKYIMNQEDHHRSNTFKSEYLGMLNEFEVQFDSKYLFDYLD